MSEEIRVKAEEIHGLVVMPPLRGGRAVILFKAPSGTDADASVVIDAEDPHRAFGVLNLLAATCLRLLLERYGPQHLSGFMKLIGDIELRSKPSPEQEVASVDAAAGK